MDLAAEEQSKHKQDIIEKERVERFSKLSAWKVCFYVFCCYYVLALLCNGRKRRSKNKQKWIK